MSTLDGSFNATGADGNDYTIGIYRDMIDTTTMRSAHRPQAPS